MESDCCFIQNDEWLYRSFKSPDPRQDNTKHFDIIDGKLRLYRGVWSDRYFKPSVDRKKLVTTLDQIKFDKEDYFVKILAKEIREISDNVLAQDGIPKRKHDVVFDKKSDRPAHSLIISEPPFTKSNKAQWKEFQRHLSLAAQNYGLVTELDIQDTR